MKQLYSDTDFQEIDTRIGQKIKNHLTRLSKQADKQKILELCQIGKLIGTYFNDFKITDISESPDFIILDEQQVVGIELQHIVDSEYKSKEGFYDNIFNKVEANLKQDEALPNFLLNLTIKENTDLKINNK